jgi:cytochrome c-type biogenesis protein CcmH
MTERVRRATAGLFTVALAAVVVVGIIAGDPTPQDRVQALGSRIKCPVCQGEAIADSPSETAEAMMQVVAEKVDEGLTDGEIYEFFRVRYGDGILLDPPFNSRTVLLWLLPVGAVAVGVFMILGRRQSAAPAEPVPGDGDFA